MSAAVVLGTAGIPVALLLGRWCRRYIGTRGIERRLEDLHRQITAWQAAHDHQVDNIDRRLRQVEESAARAEREAQIVSAQLDELNGALDSRLRQIEHRMSRGLAPANNTGACAVGPAGLRARQVVDAGAEW